MEHRLSNIGAKQEIKMGQQVRNLTPHNVNVVLEDGMVVSFEKSPLPARVTTKTVNSGNIEGLPLFTVDFGDVQNLPAQQEDVFLIVSRLVAAAASDRHDLIIPSGLVRDSEGNIIGCKGFELS